MGHGCVICSRRDDGISRHDLSNKACPKGLRWGSGDGFHHIVRAACNAGSDPYESQLGGRIHAILTTLIIGEFGGKTRANRDATLKKRLCEPLDYDRLKEAARDNAELIAFRRTCALVTFRIDDTHIHAIAHPPGGYCEPLKRAFETALSVQIYSVPSSSRNWAIIEHKALRLEIGVADREMLRRAQLQATCQEDGILRVTAPRKPGAA